MSPTAANRADADDIRRLQILDVAVDLASSGGLSSVRMRDVACGADVSIATVYQHFPSKTHLLVTVLRDELAYFAINLPPADVASASPRVRMSAVVSRLITAMENSARMTEALTHAYAASALAASGEAISIRKQTNDMFADVMSAGHNPARYEEVAGILCDVWAAEILALVQQRRTFRQLRRQLLTAIDLLVADVDNSMTPP